LKLSHYFHPKLLALTHIAALGFITSIIFGSLFQMMPVIFEVSIYSEKLGRFSFYTLLPGLILLSYGFWVFDMGLATQAGGTLILISFISFGANFWLSVRKVKSWTVESEIISTSVIWLITTATVGLLLVFNFTYVFIPKSHLEILKIHAHLGLVGWIFLLILGVSAKLVPMFFVSDKPAPIYLKFSYYTSNAGLIMFAVSVYSALPEVFTTVSSVLIVCGIIYYLVYVFLAYWRRTRIVYDTGLRLTVISFVILAVLIPLALIIPHNIADERNMVLLRIVYGFLALIGFAGVLIIGQALKIIPFIIWMYKYQSLAGTKKIPLPKDLISESVSGIMMYSFLAGLVIMTGGILLSMPYMVLTASLLFILAALSLNANIFKALFYK
jgi:hypothetical protein